MRALFGFVGEADWAETVAVMADINTAALNHPECACMANRLLDWFSD
jgi:hypothetical protein